MLHSPVSAFPRAGITVGSHGTWLWTPGLLLCILFPVCLCMWGGAHVWRCMCVCTHVCPWLMSVITFYLIHWGRSLSQIQSSQICQSAWPACPADPLSPSEVEITRGYHAHSAWMLGLRHQAPRPVSGNRFNHWALSPSPAGDGLLSRSLGRIWVHLTTLKSRKIYFHFWGWEPRLWL